MAEDHEDCSLQSRRKIQEVIGLMQKNLECSICLEMMNNPVSTNCGHQFCRFCLMEFLERKKQVPCPLCKKMITKRSLMDRSQLGQMVDNVRSLISAFQADTGMLFSPPRGPQTVDLISCTPDCIQAKTVTEINGRSTSSLDKKIGKQRNVRISRRKTLDNAEISFSTGLEQTGNSGISDSNGTSSYIAEANKRQVRGKDSPPGRSRTRPKTDNSSTELLQCIENGVHCRTATKRQHRAAENAQAVIIAISDSQNTENKTNESNESLHSVGLNRQDSKIQKSVSDEAGLMMGSENEICCEIGENENESSLDDMTVHESVKEEKGLLFQTPLPVKIIDKLRKRPPDQTEDSNFNTKNLRSRDKKSSNRIEENINSMLHEEQLTPDTLNENDASLTLEQRKHGSELKTYSKRGLNKQDKEANKKVQEWLKSVDITNERKEAHTVVSEIRSKKGKTSKKELKVKAEEEKMGLKLKHLAEHINTDKTEELDRCFGFVEDADTVRESRAKQEDDDKSKAGILAFPEENNKNDIQIQRVSDMPVDQENQRDGIELVEKTNRLDNVSESGEQIYENEEKTLSDSMIVSKEIKKQSPQNCQHINVSLSPQSTLLNKKHIFRAKATNKENITKECITVDSKKGISEIKESKIEKKAPILCHGAENRLVNDQDLPDSDPYEFKSSGNTPKKSGKRKGKASKLGVRKKITKPLQGMDRSKIGSAKGTAKSRNNQGKRKSESQVICIEDRPISYTQEEIKQISNKLNQAEDYDLLTCTQEAVDSLEKHNIDMNNKLVAYSVDTEMVEIKDHINETKLKASEQKKVRFREPLISDFIHTGKIDILGYRKAKEKMQKSESSKFVHPINDTSEAESEVIPEVEVSNSEEGINVDSDMTQFKAEKEQITGSKSHENADQENNGDHNNLAAVDGEPRMIEKNKRENALQNIHGKSQVIKIRDSNGRMTPTKIVDSTTGVFKNPMMTPTTLKRSPGVKVSQQNDTFDDDLNSSGTDDLDIHPEGDQFEEPNLEIQPDDIKEKLSSQELFVRNVLSSPQECASCKPTPQIIKETPMVFSVPTQNTFKKPKKDSNSKNKANSDQDILSVNKTPLITVNDSLSQSLKKPLSEQSKENACDSEANYNLKQPSSNDSLKDQEGSDETQPPSDTVAPSTVENTKFCVPSQPKSNIIEMEMVSEPDSSVENSVSLLDQNDHNLNLPVRSTVKNNEDESVENCVENNVQLIDVEELVPKSKKKRKSFMLDEDDDNTSSVSSPVQNASKQLSKRKRLSRSHSPKAQKSNTEGGNVTENLSQNSVIDSRPTESNLNEGSEEKSTLSIPGVTLINDSLAVETQNGVCVPASLPSLETIQEAELSHTHNNNTSKSMRSKTKLPQVASMDIVTISDSMQSDISTLDPQNLVGEQDPASQASCIPQTNSEVLCASSPIKKKQIKGEDLGDGSLKDNTDTNVKKELYLKSCQKMSQTDSICMVPETEIIDCNDTSHLNSGKVTEECQNLKETEVPNVHFENENGNSQNVSTSTEMDKSQIDLNSLNKPKAKRKTKNMKKSLQGEEADASKTKSNKHRHLSGMLVSPDEHLLCSGSKGSSEDIFNMDSEMPFVDNSPFEDTIKPVYLSEEDAITDSMALAQETELEGAEIIADLKSASKGDHDETSLSRIQVKVETKKEAIIRTKSEADEAKHSKQESDSESNLSQQAIKRKRTSGVKGARGFANKKKQSGSSNSNSDISSPILAKSSTPDKSSFRNHILRKLSPYKTGLETKIQKEIIETNFNNLSDTYGNQNKDNKELHAEINDNVSVGTPNDLPDLSQRVSQNENHKNDADADINIVSSGISEIEETGTELVNSVKQLDTEKRKDMAKTRLKDGKLSQSKKEEKVVENDADTSSSEFELSSSSEHSQNHVQKSEPEDIDKCIKEAKTKITDIENTLSEIRDKNSDNESCMSSQEHEDNVVCSTNSKHHKRTKSSEADMGDGLYRKVDTSSPLPEINTEEPMEVLESDIELDDSSEGPVSKEKSKTGDMNSSDSDSDEGPVTKKKSKKAVIADSSSEDEDDNSHHMNMTSSSAFSSQSENLTTQDRQALEKDLERMAKEMEVLKAQLNRGHGHAANRSSSEYTGQSEKGDLQVVAVEDSSDLDEHIEMDESAGENSDNDLFMSPPPLALSQNDVSNWESNHTTTSQPDEADKPTTVTSQRNGLIPKARPALADLDVSRPLSPGRRTPKAFVATGLTLHQVQEVKKLASLNDCKFYTKFNEFVTHVIVKPSKESEFLCDRTLKLFQGIANKCWIVNYYWVMDSRHAGHLVPEGPYEIQGDTANGEQHQGPRKSRTSLTKLFDKFAFMCVGDCPGLTVDDMESLIQTCGGEVVPDVDVLRNTDRTPLIVTCSDIEDEDGDVQVSSQDIAAYNRLYKSHQVVTVSREWVLDSLTLYQLQPLKEYVVTSVKNMTVPKIPVS